jgi:hypothetical protein
LAPFFFLSFLSLGSCCSPLATASVVVVVEVSTGFSDCAEAFGTLADFSD